MDFDETRLYYSHQQLQQPAAEGNDNNEDANDAALRVAVNGGGDEDTAVDLAAARRHFREFLRNYQVGARFWYREKLLRMHRRLGNHINKGAVNNNAKLQVDLSHLEEYDPALLGFLMNQPAVMLPPLEQAASDALQSLLYDMNKASDGTNNNHSQDDEEDEIMGTQATENNNDNTNNNNNNTPELTDEVLFRIQILLQGKLKLTPLRQIKSEHMHRLLKCPGIIISTSPVKSRAVQLAVRCATCGHERALSALNEGPWASISMPVRCPNNNAAAAADNPNEGAAGNAPQCGIFPYAVVPDDSQFVDQQTLKLQETPEKVPTGEMPRSVLLAVDRALVDTAPPGTRVAVLCIPTLLHGASDGSGKEAPKTVYLRVVGMAKDDSAHGNAGSVTVTPAEEEAFVALSRNPNVYDILSRSMAPSLRGSYTVDIKKALICQLFSGSRKRLQDGVQLRGDINVLLLGDPSTAKSQFLKFASQVAPVGIYTSGKGSSAAGLTASVVRNAKGEFYLEGGAMVLADGGIVCIDEFDKMRPADRVAIHEAMEQQTISIAKAGITTVLNSRSSVLAAANPVFGRYDDFKSASENIDLMTTILSRFDLIFLVRDIREEERDRMICQHVMGVHINSTGSSGGGFLGTSSSAANTNPFAAAIGMAGDDTSNRAGSSSTTEDSSDAIADNVMQVATTGEGELSVQAMKKYIQYCKSRCAPRLTEEAGEVLASNYVKIRDNVRKQGIANSSNGHDFTQSTIPITVRQLEALVRVSESLAKMRLDPDVRAEDVAEALRLFQVSTMTANAVDENNSTSSLMGASQQEMNRTEEYLRARMHLGSVVNRRRLMEEAAGQGHNAIVLARCFQVMIQKGEVTERNQGRLLKRVK
ncbi:Zygotic DNA replication licensing factor mcm3 [Seminavis robusta]|uniref:DNA replication licensing factor MCM5 n=1 Tax=Seminavis robusta TaxID=568900 RepID=A0A9N8F0Q3_9STRA|nr:Zygotic DNA replication licensing factor mcm3 [Seminavis robusta]|eukprot:Sro2445_g327910.1 Zygotic DNA replication licensing factor mcm3 (873) ;mRNA; r:6632-9421